LGEGDESSDNDDEVAIVHTKGASFTPRTLRSVKLERTGSLGRTRKSVYVDDADDDFVDTIPKKKKMEETPTKNSRSSQVHSGGSQRGGKNLVEEIFGEDEVLTQQ
jgi:hypothetical protein